MSRFHTLLSRIRGTLLGARMDDDFDDEIEAHLEMQAEEFVRHGMSPADARLAARRRFGGVDQIKEQYRDQRGIPALESLVRDVGYSVRLLRRTPGFAVTAIVTLAIGIGSTTAMFTLLNRALLQPLPVNRPDRLVALNNFSESGAFPTFSYPTYRDLRARSEAFAGLVGYRFAPLSVSHDGVNERIWGYLVTGNYFDVLGVPAHIGRALQPSDDERAGAHPVTVVSYRFWQQRLGGAAAALGRSILVNGRSYTVVGVAPRGFFGTEVVAAPDLWFPMAMQPQIENAPSWLERRDVENVFVIGRLAPHVTSEQATAIMAGATRRLAEEYPDVEGNTRVALSRPGLIGTAMRAPVLGFAGLLLLLAALVLLLACVNLANLLLARGADRRREIAVRLSIGAGRWSLVRQLLTESVLLSVAAGALGLVLAVWLVGLATAIRLPIDLPVAVTLPIDWRVLLFNVLLSLATGALFGLMPALQTTRGDLVPALKDGVPSAHRHDRTWKKALIVVQVAVSVVLLVGGGLVLRGLGRAYEIPLGFVPQRAAEVSFDLRLQGYATAAGREFQRELLTRVRAVPGVRHAALADMIPVDLHFTRTRVYADTGAPRRETRAPVTMFSRVTPGYFQTMATRLEEGREFTAFDVEGSAPVAIVNRTAARRLWPGERAIGRRLRLGSADAPALEVVGIVEDGKYAGLNENPQLIVHRPLFQSYSGSTTVIVRADGALPGIIAVVRRAVGTLDPAIPIASARTLEDRLAVPLLPARVTAWVLASFGALALVLAAVGLYGVMSYMVASRTHEIGVRMAMGARRVDVLTLVLRQGLTLAAIGLAAGLVGAVALTPLMRALLFGVSSTDGFTYGTVFVVLALVAMVACFVPARRATRMDPVFALRGE